MRRQRNIWKQLNTEKTRVSDGSRQDRNRETYTFTEDPSGSLARQKVRKYRKDPSKEIVVKASIFATWNSECTCASTLLLYAVYDALFCHGDKRLAQIIAASQRRGVERCRCTGFHLYDPGASGMHPSFHVQQGCGCGGMICAVYACSLDRTDSAHAGMHWLWKDLVLSYSDG